MTPLSSGLLSGLIFGLVSVGMMLPIGAPGGAVGATSAGVIKEKRRTTQAFVSSVIGKGSRARVGAIVKIYIPHTSEVAQIAKESVAAGGRLVVE